jgi:hypothetical protein
MTKTKTTSRRSSGNRTNKKGPNKLEVGAQVLGKPGGIRLSYRTACGASAKRRFCLAQQFVLSFAVAGREVKGDEASDVRASCDIASLARR